MPDYTTQLLPECHADTALIRFFIPNHSQSIHCQGCPEVANTMRSSQAEAFKFIGIVDNDKKLHIHCGGYFNQFEIIEQENKLIVKRSLTTQHYLIIVDKAIESFLLWNAEQVGLSLQPYGLGDTVKRLGIQLKTPTIETDPDYLQLLTDLHTRQAPGFITLERILHEFF